ncbi:AspT/YidE/YbjL antiporter-like protein [Dysgonomonas sp. PH5-45]|uniref:putative transporter n=1 Tax=unclassified Dysgonomonas TaxID=2630389 RepID=UPI002473BBAA|nr:MULTISPECIES: putative transporter [unclassified Dysgonomonas]MDH6354810.1 AspT/YidE/YbjL antiporter-like protein [Dysgonomonas sp. PH5-45]MDH6387709.1 AspT/YidE/YbjL antiporter-like protein [Dysgonomonas sp. PH5-37]
MDWLENIIFTPSTIQTVILISAVSAIGLQLGKIKIFNISLGITFVFFMGIVLGHFGMDVNRDMLYFAQNFGLILFIYSLGLQVGPGFFPSLKKGGLKLNIAAFSVIILGILTTLVLHYTIHVPLPDMVGILCGAVTNTPALGAAQQTLAQMVPDSQAGMSSMALACAIAYPLGVVGVILAIALIRNYAMPKSNTNDDHEKKDKGTYVGEFQVRNPKISGKTIMEIMQHSPKKFVISRIWRDGKVTIPTSDSQLFVNDHLLVISIKADVNDITALLGEQENVDWNKEDVDWNHIDNSHLVSRLIIITRKKFNGVKLGSLKLRNIYGINITRVNRAGIELLASPELSLQMGDKLTIVGEYNAIENVAKLLGNEVKRLRNPNLIAIFTGIALGLILGSIPIPFPGMSVPIKLGIAGGPIIVGILMGAFGPRIGLTTYTTQSANLMLRQLGIVIYLACLGLDAGEHFFETIFQGDGLLWVALGFTITIVPVLIVGFASIKIFRFNYSKTAGMLCGSMANPMALDYANSLVDTDEPAVGYATVYPVSMFLRIIFAQLILALLL